MTSIANSILHASPLVAILLVFLLPALESSIFVGFIFPGETAVVIGGVIASQHRVPLWGIIVASSLGAIIGDSIGYWVGKRWGHALLERATGRFLKPSRVRQAVAFVARRGGPGVFIGRFTTVLRVLVPGAAGMSEMPYGVFLLFNALGGIAWASLFSILGYVAGSSYQRVIKDASTAGLFVLGAVAIVVLAFFLTRYLREFKKERPEESTE